MLRAIQRARSEESGFTLIELLIVIVILGILAGVVIFSVGGVTDTGNLAACKTDIKTVAVAVEAFKAKNGGFPLTLTELADGTGTNQFLRPQAGLADTTLTQTQGNYVITYVPATGELTSNMANC